MPNMYFMEYMISFLTSTHNVSNLKKTYARAKSLIFSYIRVKKLHSTLKLTLKNLI